MPTSPSETAVEAPPLNAAPLRGRRSFLTAAAVIVVALWASGAPAMVYPVYTAEWLLQPIVITTIFALYPVSLVIVLVVFGGISDYIGRRATLLIGLAIILAGVLVFALAPGVEWLFIGRVLQGIGVGLAISPAGAALVEFNPNGKTSTASSVNTAAAATGLALATVVGGALVQYAPLPSHLTFWVLAVVVAVVFVAVWFLPRGVVAQAAGPWRPRPLLVPRGIRLVFAIGTLSITAGFAMGALFLSLGSQIAKDLIKTDNALLAGAVMSVSALVMIAIVFIARSFSARTSIIVGGVTTAVGMLLLVAAAMSASIVVFLLSSLVAGAGYGLLFLGGLTIVNQYAPVHHRAGTLSAVYLIAYLAQGLTAVAVGSSATTIGLQPALDLWSPLIAVVCVLATVLALTFSRSRRVALA
ncbi:MAG: MFS transporter [Rhodoglobus sp.]